MNQANTEVNIEIITDGLTIQDDLDVLGKIQLSGTDVLLGTTLGASIVNSSLENVGTLSSLNVTGLVKKKIEFAAFQRTSNQSISDDSWNKIVWQTESVTSDLYSIDSGDIKFTTPGIYDIEIQIVWDVNSTGVRALALGDSVDPHEVRQYSTASNNGNTNRMRHMRRILNANDKVEVRLYQNSGGSLNMDYQTSWIIITYLGES